MDIPKNGVFFFDSGIGGLTVLAECKKQMPSETFYYYGDNTRAPYGNLKEETIFRFVSSVFDAFSFLTPQAAVLACNTATAVCVERLRRQYSFPIVGAEPAIVSAAKGGGVSLVLTTRATYQSARFQSLCKNIEKAYPQCRLLLQPCDGLAGEIERRIFTPNWDVRPFLPTATPDSVVLGCTHYVYMKEQIAAHYKAKTYDGNEGMAKRLRYYIEKTPPKAIETTAFDACHYDGIYFLGESKWSNKCVYEQMFGVKTPQSGCRVVKYPKNL
jgi:glutamate racemase